MIPAYSLDYPHTDVNNISCDSCHYIYAAEPSLLPPWTVHVPQDIDDTQYNTLCWSCHNDIEAPYMRTHSSLQIDDDYGDWTVECRTCHDPHSQDQLKAYTTESFLYSGTSTGITSTTLTESGAGWTEDEYEGLLLIPNVDRPTRYKYSYKITGNTSDTITVEGPINLSRAAAGDTFAIIYGKLIKSVITLDDIIDPWVPKTGDRTVRFFYSSGTNSFADGDSTYDGICEVCHTETSYHQNDGEGSSHNAGTDCRQCHNHVFGFAHGGGGASSNCEECHGHDPGYGGFTGGKGSYISHSTHTENDSDDLRGPNVGCATCHDTTSMPYFNSGDDANEDGRIVLSETDVCDTCHSPGGTYDGVNDGTLGAKNNWSDAGSSTSPIYAADGSLQPGKEKWCATCHDETPSQISSIDAPNVIGDEDGSYTYGTGWGFYKTGHGLAADIALPSSGGVSMGAGKGCLDCHESTVSHIDGDARTYSAGGDDNGDAYRAGFRLRQVDLGEGPVNPMRLPFPDIPLTKEKFALCASCHDPDPFLGTNNNTNLISGGVNRHAYHLNQGNAMQGRYDSDWNGANDSRVNCTICHNVHGSKRLTMVRDGTLVNREGFDIWYANPDIVYNESNNLNPPEPQNLTLIQSTGIIMSEYSSTRMCSACHNRNYTTYYPRGTLYWDSDVPALDWTFEEYYLDRGIHTDRFFNTTDTALFRIKYFDPNNDAPSRIEVWIDHNDDGSYDAGEITTMVEDDEFDTTYTDGKIYTATVILTDPGDKTMIYRFYASDGLHDAAGQPATQQVIEWDDNFTRDVPDEYENIQDAVDAAYDGNTIIVSDGTYNENVDYRGKDLIIQSVNGAAVTSITGSGSDNPVVAFDGGEPSSTVLDGFTIDNVDTGTYYNMRGISISNGAEPQIINSIITGNNTRGKGAGILIDGGAATIENCTIENNNTSYETGAGIHIENATATTTITDSSISSNTAKVQGGGLYVTNSDIELTNVTMDSNHSSEGAGGGVYFSGNVNATISGGSISSNTAKYSGGGLFFSGGGGGSLSISDCTINSNLNNTTSPSNGGGLYLSNIGSTTTITNTSISYNDVMNGGGGIYADTAPLSLDGCTINGNDASNTNGGGVWLNTSSTISNSTITNNSTSHTPQYGGGIYGSGASTVLTITNTNVDNNQSNNGAGIYFSGQQLNFTGGSINGNMSPGQYSGGGLKSSAPVTMYGTEVIGNSSGNGAAGIYCGDLLTITNSIVANNNGGSYYWASGGGISASSIDMMNGTVVGNVTSWGGGINVSGGGTVTNSICWGNYSYRDSNTRNFRGDPTSATVSYTDTAGGGYVDGGNNISVDPLFLNERSYTESPTTDGDYHLQGTSPVKDQATSTGAPTDDIDGDSRYSGAGYDMGADEYIDDPNATVTGTATAEAGSDTSIDVSMSYTEDANADNTYTVEYKLSSSGSWVDWETNPKAHSASPFEDTITGLTIGETYDVRMTYNDADGINGTAQQIVSDIDLTVYVDLTSSSQSVAEDAGTVTVTATLTIPNNSSDVTVPFTVGGTATGGGTDHDLADGDIIVTSGQLTGTTTFNIINDDLDENDETVIVTMGTPVNASAGEVDVHTVTITDDDATPAVTFTSPSQSTTDETGTAAVTAELSAVSGRDVTVPFTVNGGSTAEGSGTDYSITSSPITIIEGSTTADITVTVETDSLDEDNETVIVDMGTPVNATQGAIISHTVTITDDDVEPAVTFTSASQSTADETGTATITAELSVVSGRDVTVPFTVNAASTAEGGGTDYSITSSPVTITEGSTTADITVTITEEVYVEDDETVIVDMGAPVNAAQGSTTTHTLTITNDDTDAPVGGYITANVIPAAQITQSSNGDGIVTITWKGLDNNSANVTLKTFEYSVSGGSIWNAPVNSDASGSLSTNWDDNGGGGYTTATTFGTATAHSFAFDTDHADVSGLAGVDQSDVQIRFTLNDGSYDSTLPATSESFRVDNVVPTDTIASADYDAGTDTMTITGSNFTTIATAGADIKSYVDWTKFVWDINGDDAATANITFVEGEVTSLTVTNDATLTLVFTSVKASTIEATTGYGTSGGADTLDVIVGFSKDAAGNAATTDGADDAPLTTGVSYAVTKTDDTDDGTCDADCSIREAIAAANADPDQNDITIPAGTYTITRSGSDDTNVNGDFDITNPVNIFGAGSGVTIIRAAADLASAADRIFHDTSLAAVKIEGVTIQYGKITATGGCILTAGNLTIKDSIVDSCTATSNNGGAIYTSASVTIDNSTISNGTAGNNGGAIYTNGLTITNGATFTDNYSTNKGGAIYNAGTSNTITGSGTITFTNNDTQKSTTDYGGAIYSDASIAFTGSSSFTNNDSLTGGAIFLGDSGATISLESTTFESNTSTGSGGAMYTYGLSVSGGATFRNNYSASKGGAIYSQGANPIEISGVTEFTNNDTQKSTDDWGGAIYSQSDVTISSQSTFTNNDGLTGGAIFIDSTTATVTLYNPTFDTNTATGSGGAIYTNGLTITGGATFLNNYTASKGGAIYSKGINPINISGVSTFTNNDTAKGTDDWGGAIYSEGNVTFNDASTFTSNDALSGGAIIVYNSASTLSMVSPTFISNTVTSNGGAVWTYGMTITGGATFTDNYAGNSGGAVFNNTGNFSIDGTATFTNNDSLRNAGTDDGGAVWSSGNFIHTNGTITFENNDAWDGGAVYLDTGKTFSAVTAVFNGNSATGGGGAIVSRGLTITNGASFQNNSAPNYTGGAIYNTTNPININGTILFDNNDAGTGTDDRGGAIYSNADVTLNDVSGTSTFQNSQAYEGGAIFVDSGAPLTLSGATFDANNAPNIGGAIRMYGGTLTDVSFTNNYVTNDGGAIYNSTNLLTINGSANTFNGNYAGNASGDIGGTIFSSGSLTVSNAVFTGRNDGTADAYEGGAIFTYDTGDVLTISNSSFNSFYAVNIGGAIRMYGGTLTDVSFTNNYVTNDGGAILNSTNALTINGTSNTFTGNYAGTASGDVGGCIYTSGSLTISNAAFTGRNDGTADAYEGGAISLVDSTDVLTITDSSFDSFKSLNVGGAIRCYGATINKSTFSNNSVAGGGNDGGSVYNSGPLSLFNSTFSANNVTDLGGGLFQSGNATIKNSTFYDNTAGTGEAIYTNSGTVTVANTLVAKATSSSSLCYNVTSNDYNLQYNGTCFTAQANDRSGDPLLSALANNGGPTMTHALNAGSDAIDNALGSVCTDADVNSEDQRGEVRTTTCDIGAYEDIP